MAAPAAVALGNGPVQHSLLPIRTIPALSRLSAVMVGVVVARAARPGTASALPAATACRPSRAEMRPS